MAKRNLNNNNVELLPQDQYGVRTEYSTIIVEDIEHIPNDVIESLHNGDVVVVKEDDTKVSSVVSFTNEDTLVLNAMLGDTMAYIVYMKIDGDWVFGGQRDFDVQEKLKILYFNESGTLLTPNTFDFTQTAMIVYAYKPSGQITGLLGGMQPLFNNDENVLYVSSDQSAYLVVQATTDDETHQTTLTIDKAGLGYYRVMVLNIPIEMPF